MALSPTPNLTGLAGKISLNPQGNILGNIGIKPKATPAPPVKTAVTGATAPTPTKITAPTASPTTSSGGAGQYYGNTIDTKGDIGAQIAAIDKQRASTATDPSLGSSAAQSYLNSQTNPIPEGTQNPPKPEPTSYDLALKSYLNSLKDSQNLTSQYRKETLEGNRAVDSALDRSGGLQSGNEASARLLGRRANSELGELGYLKDSATNEANLAFQRMQFEQGRLPSQDPYTLSAGQTRFDAKGNPIASLPETGSDSPTSVQEYEYAKSNGYTGSYAAFKNSGGSGDSNRVLSATEAQSLGVPFGTTAAQAYGISPTKPLTEAQAKDVTYGERGQEANTLINGLESVIAGYNPATFAAYTALEPGKIGNSFVPDDIRQIRQAERNLATAILRRESGAAISASEFSTVEKQYFPRPGDDAQTLAQKRQNRDTAIKSFLRNANQSGVQGGSSGSGTISWDSL